MPNTSDVLLFNVFGVMCIHSFYTPNTILYTTASRATTYLLTYFIISTTRVINSKHSDVLAKVQSHVEALYAFSSTWL